MENPKKVHENLKQLLMELQKVKDLNNLANEYKAISANLVLSLQDYLNDSRAFSSAFNEYLAQTNKSVEETRNVFDNAVKSINDVVKKLRVADGTMDKKAETLSIKLSQLEQQSSKIANLYDSCLTMERQVGKDVEKFISKATDEISSHNNEVLGKMENLLASLTTQISKVNQSVIERLNQTDKKIETVNEQSKKIGSQINAENQHISLRVDNLNKAMAQEEELLSLHQIQRQNEHKVITSRIDASHNDMVAQISQSRKALVNATNSNERTMQLHANRLSEKINNVLSFQKIVLSLLAFIIILVFFLILK